MKKYIIMCVLILLLGCSKQEKIEYTQEQTDSLFNAITDQADRAHRQLLMETDKNILVDMYIDLEKKVEKIKEVLDVKDEDLNEPLDDGREDYYAPTRVR